MSFSREDRQEIRDDIAAGKFVAWGCIFAVIPIVLFLCVLGYALGWFTETAAVVKEQFGPREALRKYEWFKDVAATLEKKQADIKVFTGRLDRQKADYDGVARKDWPRDEREQRGVWEAESAGIKASYNQLAADYNAQMAKFNWRFANAGELPQGAAEPLPREFKTYVSE